MYRVSYLLGMVRTQIQIDGRSEFVPVWCSFSDVAREGDERPAPKQAPGRMTVGGIRDYPTPIWRSRCSEVMSAGCLCFS